MKKALITGKNGQLGQHLVKFFQDEHPDIEIIATVRHKSYDKQDFIFDDSKVQTELLDLTDSVSIEECIRKNKPDYIFNTGANAFVGESWSVPESHAQINALGVVRILEAIRKFCPQSRFVNLGTSEELGCTLDDQYKGAQTEETIIEPKSPYACSKVFARQMIDVYRNSYGIYATQPWTFNFESKLRGEKYVTRKITKGVARIFHSIRNKDWNFQPIELGNLNSFRSWQHASDVAKALWLVANQISTPKPYVISENDTHSIREFVEKAFKAAGINGLWSNPTDDPLDEEFILAEENGLATKRKITLVSINAKFFRPHDVSFLYGDSTKIRTELGWKPEKTLDDIILEMVENDLKTP
jgi:GDPmannose 4,6-dehydratase